MTGPMYHKCKTCGYTTKAWKKMNKHLLTHDLPSMTLEEAKKGKHVGYTNKQRRARQTQTEPTKRTKVKETQIHYIEQEITFPIYVKMPVRIGIPTIILTPKENEE